MFFTLNSAFWISVVSMRLSLLVRYSISRPLCSTCGSLHREEDQVHLLLLLLLEEEETMVEGRAVMAVVLCPATGMGLVSFRRMWTVS